MFTKLLPRFAYSGQFLLENMFPIPHSGVTIGTNLTLDMSGATLTLPSAQVITTPTITAGLTASGSASNDFSGSTGTFKTSTGASTFGGSSNSFTNAITPVGGVAAPGNNFTMGTVFHSGGYNAIATTGANQKQIVTTETYFVEVFIPANTTITGISVLNGHTTATQNIFVGLARADGTIVASSNTTTAQGTADTFQQIPFSVAYAAIGPAKYFIAVQSSQTTGFIATHAALGNFGANKKTGETYGTFLTTATYATTTYTANLGPIADTY